MKRYMIGNLVKFKNKVYKIISATSETVDLISETSTVVRNIDIQDIEGILLSDEFFLKNRYRFDNKTNLFMSVDGYGPAIYKSFLESYFYDATIQYSITGIIINTVDEFQNLLNIIHCESIADKIIL